MHNWLKEVSSIGDAHWQSFILVKTQRCIDDMEFLERVFNFKGIAHSNVNLGNEFKIFASLHNLLYTRQEISRSSKEFVKPSKITGPSFLGRIENFETPPGGIM